MGKMAGSQVAYDGTWRGLMPTRSSVFLNRIRHIRIDFVHQRARLCVSMTGCEGMLSGTCRLRLVISFYSGQMACLYTISASLWMMRSWVSQQLYVQRNT